MITRENYESYLLDYLEGNLPPHLVSEMKVFLLQNPDIAAEAEALPSVGAGPVMGGFPDKDQLKKPVVLSPGEATYNEERCVRYLEGDMEWQEAEAFEAECKFSGGLGQELRLFRATFLSPGPVAFPDKPQLKRTRIVPLFALRSLAVAAGLALLFSLGWWARQDAPHTRPGPVPQQAQHTLPALPYFPYEKILFIPGETAPAPGPKTKPAPVYAFKAENAGVTQESNKKTEIVAHRPETKEPLLAHQKPGLPTAGLPPTQAPANEENPYERLVMEEVEKKIAHVYDTSPTPTVLEYLGERLRSPHLQHTRKELAHKGLWALAEMGVNGIGKLTGGNMHMKNAYNQEGRVEHIAFSSRLLEVEVPVRN